MPSKRTDFAMKKQVCNGASNGGKISRKLPCIIRYEVRAQKPGVYGINAIFFGKDTIRPTLRPSSAGSPPVAELFSKMEQLWKTSPSLNNCRYLPDIGVILSKAGLPSHSLVWPNLNDQRINLPKTPGLHSPFAYVAEDKFGAVFNCHREDFNLVNVNYVIKVVVDLLVQGKAFAWLRGEERD